MTGAIQSEQHVNEEQRLQSKEINPGNDTTEATLAQTNMAATTSASAPSSPGANTTNDQNDQKTNDAGDSNDAPKQAPSRQPSPTSLVGQNQQQTHGGGRKKTPPVRADDGTTQREEAVVEPVTDANGHYLSQPNNAVAPTGGRTSARGGPSRYRGVVWHKSNSKWEARIYECGKQKFLGYFTVEDEAAMAYDDYAVRLHGANAKLNFPARYEGRLPAVSEKPVAAPKTTATRSKPPPRRSPAPASAAAPAGTTALNATTTTGGNNGTATTATAAGTGGGGGRRVQPIKGSSRFRGVSWNSNCSKWRAQVWKGSEVHHLGYFEDEEDAARAYDEAVLKIRGPESPTNFPKSDYGVYLEAGQVDISTLKKANRKTATERPVRANAAASVAATVKAIQGYPSMPLESQPSYDANTSASPFYGVSWNTGNEAWNAEIWDGEKYIPLGAFNTEAQAAREYDLACLEKHGSQALTNFPLQQYEAELAAISLTNLAHKDGSLPTPPADWPATHPYVQYYLQHQQQQQQQGTGPMQQQQPQSGFGNANFQQRSFNMMSQPSADAQKLLSVLAALNRAGSAQPRPPQPQAPLPQQQQQHMQMFNQSQPPKPAPGGGVVWDVSKNQWTAQVEYQGKTHFLGQFDTEQAAREMYDKAATLIAGPSSGAPAAAAASQQPRPAATIQNGSGGGSGNVSPVAVKPEDQQQKHDLVATATGNAAAAAEGGQPGKEEDTNKQAGGGGPSQQQPSDIMQQLAEALPAVLNGNDSMAAGLQEQLKPLLGGAGTSQEPPQLDAQTLNALVSLIKTLVDHPTLGGLANTVQHIQQPPRSVALPTLPTPPQPYPYGHFQGPVPPQQGGFGGGLLPQQQLPPRQQQFNQNPHGALPLPPMSGGMYQQQQQQRGQGMSPALQHMLAAQQQQQYGGWNGGNMAGPYSAQPPQNMGGNGFGAPGGGDFNAKRARPQSAEEQMLALVQQLAKRPRT